MISQTIRGGNTPVHTHTHVTNSNPHTLAHIQTHSTRTAQTHTHRGDMTQSLKMEKGRTDRRGKQVQTNSLLVLFLFPNILTLVLKT